MTKEGHARDVFACCDGVMTNDSQIALYLLPYVTVHVLLEGSDEDVEGVGFGITSR